MFEFYQPSGRFSPAAFALLFVAVGIAIAAAFVYQLGLQWIPFIYINFLLTVGMGMLLGKATAIVIKSGHVRNLTLALLSFVSLVLAADAAKFGFQYLTDRYEVANLQPADVGLEVDRPLTEAELTDFRKLILDDYSFSDHIQSRVERGWRLGRGGGAPLSGIFVYVIWLVELGVIVYFGGLIAWEAAKQPYNEKLARWADAAQVEMSLPVTNAEMISKIKAANSVQELLELPIPDTDQSERFAIYQVNSVPGFENEDAFLTVELHVYGRNAKGEIEIKKEPLVHWAKITPEQRARLHENSELMQEAIAEYRASLENESAESAPKDDDDAQS